MVLHQTQGDRRAVGDIEGDGAKLLHPVFQRRMLPGKGMPGKVNGNMRQGMLIGDALSLAKLSTQAFMFFINEIDGLLEQRKI